MTTQRDWPIQEVARLTGTTSRTLRHYDAIGLLTPSRTAHGGARCYDAAGLVRLQRILMLRDLGLGLQAIAEALDSDQDEAHALRAHLAWLESERRRITDQIGSVRTTIDTLTTKEALVPSRMFAGFDHTAYRGEVEQRWGKDAYRAGDAWWSGMTQDERAAFLAEQRSIAQAYADARAAGLAPESDEVRAVTRRQHSWLAVSATATGQSGVTAEYFTGIGEMYVADPRFAAAYDWAGEGTAVFVRDAMAAYAREVL